MSTIAEIPSTIHVYWKLGFIDDELANVPQRPTENFPCKFIKTKDGKFYESKFMFDMLDPYNQKFHTCEYGIRSSFIIREVFNKLSFESEILSICDIPPSKIDEHLKNDIITTTGEMQLKNEFDNFKMELSYTFIVTKHTKILTGFEIKIPTEKIVSFVLDHRDKMRQMFRGL